MHEIRVHGVQLELLKAQLMAFERTLDDLGRAIAPDAGIDAAAHRFAELRDQIQRLDRARPRAPAAGSTRPRTSPGSRRKARHYDAKSEREPRRPEGRRRLRLRRVRAAVPWRPAPSRDDARRAVRRAARRSRTGARRRLRSRRPARRAARGRHRGPRRGSRCWHGRRSPSRGLDVVRGDGLAYLAAVERREPGSDHGHPRDRASGVRRPVPLPRPRLSEAATRRDARVRDPEPDRAHRARPLVHPRSDPQVAAAPVARDVPVRASQDSPTWRSDFTRLPTSSRSACSTRTSTRRRRWR